MKKWLSCSGQRLTPIPVHASSQTSCIVRLKFPPVRRSYASHQFRPSPNSVDRGNSNHLDNGTPPSTLRRIQSGDDGNDTPLERIKRQLESIETDWQENTSNSGERQHNGMGDPADPTWENFKKTATESVILARSRLSPKHKMLRSLLAGSTSPRNVREAIIRAYQDFKLEAQGYDVTRALGKIADFRHPTEWYNQARSIQRTIHLHIGPTNSGKTYRALKRLEEAGSGFYAGPLRLLAHEVYSRFQAKGTPCHLVTGDDVRWDEDMDPNKTPLISSTVEMVNLAGTGSVGVIDEIQMLEDPERGWAWTRALLGAPCQELHLCGENRVLPLITELAASMGDNLKVHEYKRLNPLKCMSTSLDGDISNLQKGDAVVCFSVMGIHAMKKTIETRTGKRVAMIYGSLPPETRAAQAAMFNDPDNDCDYLVASDAIGMGLNLSIKRVVFAAVTKYNGRFRKQLSVPQIKQIAGRAGRYRTANQASDAKANLDGQAERDQNIGWVTTLNSEDLSVVRDALVAEAPPLHTAGILPPGEFLEDFAARLPAETPHDYVMQRLSEAASVHPRFTLCSLDDQISMSRMIQSIPGISTRDRHIFTAAPMAMKRSNTGAAAAVLRELASALNDRRRITIAEVKAIDLELLEEPLAFDRGHLERLEFLHQCCVLFVWLSYRMGSTFTALDMAFHAKGLVEAKIDAWLKYAPTIKEYKAKKPRGADVGEEAGAGGGWESVAGSEDDIAENRGEDEDDGFITREGEVVFTPDELPGESPKEEVARAA
jgi:ATP-dependent RNA helicase SUPV3L1/SUV3